MSLRTKIGNSLAVQWLGLCASIAGGPGLIPGQETRIPLALWCGQKKFVVVVVVFFFFKDKRHVSERSKHLSENVLILNLHWQCPSCERSCQGCIRRTHRTPPGPHPRPRVGQGNVNENQFPGLEHHMCFKKKKSRVSIDDQRKGRNS